MNRDLTKTAVILAVSMTIAVLFGVSLSRAVSASPGQPERYELKRVEALESLVREVAALRYELRHVKALKPLVREVAALRRDCR